MTADEISRVSRHWVGHLATNPNLRRRLEEIHGQDDAQLASLINETTGSVPPVAPEDVPQIRKFVAFAFRTSPGETEIGAGDWTRMGG